MSSSVGVTPNQIVVPSKMEGSNVTVRLLDNLTHFDSIRYSYFLCSLFQKKKEILFFCIPFFDNKEVSSVEIGVDGTIST